MITDTEFSESRIEKIERDGDGWALTSDEGWSLWLRESYDGHAHGIVPKVGDTLRTYGRGFGSVIRGISVNGQVCFYRTEAEDRARSAKEAADREEAQRVEFEANRADFDRRVAALPSVFWSRFNRFRRNRPNFRWTLEGYELMCCEQAVVFADTLRTTDAIKAFHAADYADQRLLVPGMSDGHSGNSFGFSCRLASLYLNRPELLEFEHGALCTLEGCESYGCRPLTDDETARLAALNG